MEKEIDKSGYSGTLPNKTHPWTTEMVANPPKLSWNTAQIHLYKLTS